MGMEIIDNWEHASHAVIGDWIFVIGGASRQILWKLETGNWKLAVLSA